MRCLALLLFVPLAAAGSMTAPELTDPEGDVTYDAGTAPPDIMALGDLRAAWWQSGENGLATTVQVADLTGLATMDATPRSQLQVVAFWRAHYNDTSGLGGRTGAFDMRATYHGGTGWEYWLERPCKDGDGDDGCAGDDRDIIDGLTGAVDVDNRTITVFAPWDLLGDPQPGDGAWGLIATVQVGWPSWPATTYDDDIDEADQCFPFAFNGTVDEGGPSTQVSEGTTGLSIRWTPPEPGACSHLRPPAPPAPVVLTTDNTTAPQNETETVAVEEDTPWPVVFTIAAVLGAAGRYRLRVSSGKT